MYKTSRVRQDRTRVLPDEIMSTKADATVGKVVGVQICQVCEGQPRAVKPLPCRHAVCEDCIAKVKDRTPTECQLCEVDKAKHGYEISKQHQQQQQEHQLQQQKKQQQQENMSPDDGVPKAVVPSQDDGVPKAVVPSQDDGVPKAVVPSQDDGVPKAVVPSQDDGVPKAVVPSQDDGVPKAVVPSQDDGVPKAGVPSQDDGVPKAVVPSQDDGVPKAVVPSQDDSQTCKECTQRPKSKLCAHCKKKLCDTCVAEHEIIVKRELEAIEKEKFELGETFNNLQEHTEPLLVVLDDLIGTAEGSVKSGDDALISVLGKMDKAAQNIIAIINTRKQKIREELENQSRESCNELKQYHTSTETLREILKSLVSQTSGEIDGEVLRDGKKICTEWGDNMQMVQTIGACPDITTLETTEADKFVSDMNKILSELSKDKSSPGDTTEIQTENVLPPVIRQIPDYRKEEVEINMVGTKGVLNGQFDEPSFVAVYPLTQNLVVSDTFNDRVQVISQEGKFIGHFGSWGEGELHLKLRGSINSGGVAVSPKGEIVVADTYNNRLQVFTESGRLIRSIGSKGSDPGQFDSPRGVAIGDAGTIYVSDWYNKRIQVLSPDGDVLKVFATRDSMGDWQPSGITVCANGDVIVADVSGKIEVFSDEGESKLTIGTGVDGSFKLGIPSDVASDEDGNILVTDYEMHQLHVLGASGDLIRTYGRRGDGLGEFNQPVGVSVAPDGRVVVVDQLNNRVQLIRF